MIKNSCDEIHITFVFSQHDIKLQQRQLQIATEPKGGQELILPFNVVAVVSQFLFPYHFLNFLSFRLFLFSTEFFIVYFPKHC